MVRMTQTLDLGSTPMAPPGMIRVRCLLLRRSETAIDCGVSTPHFVAVEMRGAARNPTSLLAERTSRRVAPFSYQLGTSCCRRRHPACSPRSQSRCHCGAAASTARDDPRAVLAAAPQ